MMALLPPFLRPTFTILTTGLLAHVCPALNHVPGVLRQALVVEGRGFCFVSIIDNYWCGAVGVVGARHFATGEELEEL